MKNKFKKIISVILVLVTLILTFTIPALAKGTDFTQEDDGRMISLLNFIYKGDTRTEVYNMVAPFGANIYTAESIKPFVTTNMKDLYVFCGSNISGSASDSLIDISPELNFQTLEVYLPFDTYAPKNSVINFNLSMYSAYYNLLKVQLINEDMEVIGSTSTGCGTGRNFYDSKAYSLFSALGLKNSTWHSDNWAYGVNSGKGLQIRETNIRLKCEMSSAERIYGVRLIFEIGSYQSAYWFNFNTCKISLKTPGSDGTSAELKEYMEYTDSLWDNVLIFFKNVGIFFENMLTQSINFFTSLPTKLSTWFNKVIDGITGLPDKIGGFFGGIGESIANYFKNTFLGQVVRVIDGFKSFLQIDSNDDYSSVDENYYVDYGLYGYTNYEYWHSLGA